VLILVLTFVVAFLLGYSLRDFYPPLQTGTRQAAAAPGAPNTVTRLPLRTFGHWNLACQQNAQNVKHCELALRVVDQKSKKLVLSMVVGRGQDGGAVLLVVTPPNALLREPVHLKTAANVETKIDYATCETGACRALAPLPADLQSALAASDHIQVSYTNASGREISYQLPNDGFKDALAAWSSQ